MADRLVVELVAGTDVPLVARLAGAHKWAAALVLVALSTSGCVSDQGTPSDEPLSNAATYKPVGEGGDGALLTGIVSSTDPCVAVTDATGTEYIPVFPRPDVSLSGGIVEFRGLELVEGAEVALTGGTVSSVPDDASIPAGCDGTFWIVAQD